MLIGIISFGGDSYAAELDLKATGFDLYIQYYMQEVFNYTYKSDTLKHFVYPIADNMLDSTPVLDIERFKVMKKVLMELRDCDSRKLNDMDSLLECNLENREYITDAGVIYKSYGTKVIGFELELDGTMLSFKESTTYMTKELDSAMKRQLDSYRFIEGKNKNDVIASVPIENKIRPLEEIAKYDYLGCKYTLITEDDAFEEFVVWLETQIKTVDPLIATDIETTGLGLNFLSRFGEADDLVGIGFTIKEGEGYYVALQHKRFRNVYAGDIERAMERLRYVLEIGKLLTHNAYFDWRGFYIYNIVPNIVHDTMIMFQCAFNTLYPDMSYALKVLTKTYLGIDMVELSDMVYEGWGHSDVNFADLPYEHVRAYAPADVDMTLRLFNRFRDIIYKYSSDYIYNLEVQYACVCAYSMFFGHKTEIEAMPVLAKELQEGMEALKLEMDKLVGYSDYNPNSSVQMVRILYDEMGCPVGAEGRSTKKDVLKDLSHMQLAGGEDAYPICKLFLEYKDLAASYKNFVKNTDPKTAKDGIPICTPDGYIFSEVSGARATTGRTLVSGPNYQSYSKYVKKRIVARPGYYAFDNDYSQIEYRTLAWLSGQENLLEAFKDIDMDYHTYQASRMFKVPYELVTKEIRDPCKAINFGIPYGMGDEKLGMRLRGAKTKENTLYAKQLRKVYFEGQDKVQGFFINAQNSGLKDGHTKTYFGRRRYYDKASFPDWKIKKQAGNAVIQGTAADIYKIGVVRVFTRLRREKLLGLVLLSAFIHDELFWEWHESINGMYLLRLVQEEMQIQVDNSCVFFSGAGFGRSWYAAKSDAVQVPVDLKATLVEKYAQGPFEGYYTGKPELLLEDMPKILHQHYINRVVTWITDVENDNKPLKPAVSAMLVDLVKADKNEKLSIDDAFVRFIEKFKDDYDLSYVITVGKTDTTAFDSQQDDTNLVETVTEYDTMDDEMSDIDYISTYGYKVNAEDMELMILFRSSALEVFNHILSMSNEEGKGYRIVLLQNGVLIKTAKFIEVGRVNNITSILVRLICA